MHYPSDDGWWPGKHPDEEAAQTVAGIIRLLPFCEMRADVAPVLAYLVDREHLTTHGHVTRESARLATPTGPVDELVRDLVAGSVSSSAWNDLLVRDGDVLRTTRILSSDDLDGLSQAIERSIVRVVSVFGAMDAATLAAGASGAFSPAETTSDGERALTLLDMALAVGHDPATARAIVDESEAHAAIGRAFRRSV
jgi:hypothetical protein